jgi:hypothetical protein
MSVQQVKDTLTTSLIEFRMAIIYFALFSLSAICSALMMSLANVTWSTLDGQGKFMIVVATVWNWATTTMAFVSKQATRIKQTGSIFPDGDTQQFTRIDTQQQKTEITNK